MNREGRHLQQRAPAGCKKINRSHTHTPTENITPDTDTHTHTTRTTPQTNASHKHLTTLEGGATTVRATSHARVGGRTCRV